jgi:hypothetical protein
MKIADFVENCLKFQHLKMYLPVRYQIIVSMIQMLSWGSVKLVLWEDNQD